MENQQPKETNYVKVSGDEGEIQRLAKEPRADEYYITFHSPHGDFKSQSFILTFAKDKGMPTFVAVDNRRAGDSMKMMIHALVQTVQLLHRVAIAYQKDEEYQNTLKEIESMLRNMKS